MTNCLTDDELQAVADNEADAIARSHVAECPSCRARVESARREIDRLAALTHRLPGPSPAFEERVQHAMHEAMQQAMHARPTAPTRGERGATTMREQMPPAPRWPRHTWTSGLAAVAVILLVVFVVLPGVRRESHLSAAEILGRSLQTFSAPATGIETLDYDVRLEGAAARPVAPDVGMAANAGAGADALRVIQMIDHDHPGRYRLVSRDGGADGPVRTMVVQDPERGVRAGRFRIDDRTYFFRFTASPRAASVFVSLPDLQRAHLRALVSMMQTMVDQNLRTVDDATGTYYAIQVPQTMSSERAPAAERDPGQALFDLRDAHALIHTGDFHLKELSARGTFFGQPFALSFTLVQHDIVSPDAVAPDAFTLEPDPGDIVLEGQATNDPAADVVLAALRALPKARP